MQPSHHGRTQRLAAADKEGHGQSQKRIQSMVVKSQDTHELTAKNEQHSCTQGCRWHLGERRGWEGESVC
eukprot:9630247-Karenia_brevis.AAC.1